MRCPLAEWRPLPENRTQPALSPRTIIDHSIVGSAEGAYGYFLNSTSLESHFIVKKDGHIIQLIDTERTADANYQANGHAISIETEDNGDPNRDPWTKAQLESLTRLHAWLADAHDIPRRKCPTTAGGGLGYHSLFGAPSAWTPSAGKTCPGTIRIKQWNDILLPAFVSGGTASLGGRVMYVCKRGDRGDAVEMLQETLRDLGQPVIVDGDFGPATEAALAKETGWDKAGYVNVKRCRELENRLTRQIVDARLARHARTPHAGSAVDHKHTATVSVELVS